eukprot:jgi/Chlat1/2353/Chrsp17S00178
MAPCESVSVRPLFGGAMQCVLPDRLVDVSQLRDVPDNQEAFVDAQRDHSVIVEILEHVPGLEDASSATWFFHDLAGEMESAGTVVELAQPLSAGDVPLMDASWPKSAAVGVQAVAKYREGPDARNLVRVHLVNVRIPAVDSDILVTLYEPVAISAQSSSATAVAGGASSACMPVAEVFRLLLSSLKISDMRLFGHE